MDISKNILLIYKPSGVTSFGLVKQIKKKYGAKKAGHAGTLDPMATGLMIVGINEGTKELKHFVGLDKTYEAEILLGIATDTGDIEGRVIASQKLKVESEKSRFFLSKIEDPRFSEGKSGKRDIMDVTEGTAGKWILPVPAYSATKQGGEALHKKARRGAKLIVPKREMDIFKSKFRSTRSENQKIYIEVEFRVSSGTYIRSIAEEIGRRLDVPATLSALHRTKIGEFDIKDAVKI